ncbi:hypothetical protein [Rhodococcus sp. UFZ-B548]|uniref:hypothetical protein n=1 Tax=Rhodococcus sp. UFZ-B548 TaxID=2742212 RepID=UPI0015F76C76|nr:hypothetical protein [Rhodococcus sp. UFZ-B548]
MAVEQTLPDDKQLASLDLEQLRQFVGLVAYDNDYNAFTVSGWGGLQWSVETGTQAPHFFQPAFGIEIVAYSLPVDGNRSHYMFLPKSDTAPSVVNDAVNPASELIEHHSRHSDCIRYIALSVPAVDSCAMHTSPLEPHANGGTVNQHD